VPNGTGRVGGAFGLFDRPIGQLRADLHSLRERCKNAASLNNRPNRVKYPLDRLRHLYAHVMQLDVIFQPLKRWIPVRDELGRMHGKWCEQKFGRKRCSCTKLQCRAFRYTDNPVWGKAPDGALWKARKLSSLLNTVVTHGYLCDISRELERLSIVMWTMSKRHFTGLLRRISAKIAESMRSIHRSGVKSEPDVHFAMLTSNPTSLRGVNWVAPKYARPKKKSRKYVPRYIPPWRRKEGYSVIGDDEKALISAIWS